MIEIKLWLFVVTDFLTVDIDVNIFSLSEDLESRVDGDWLTDSQIIDRVVAIWNILQINKGLSSQIWFVMIPFNGGHRILVKANHPLGDVFSMRIIKIILVLLVVIEERLKHLKFISLAYSAID